jgi:probable addiction module antidote protein
MAEQKLSIFDPAAALDSLEAVAIFLADTFETGDAAYVANALGVIARAKGMAELADAAGLERGPLKDALEAGQLSLDATLAIMKVIDLHLPPRTGTPA